MTRGFDSRQECQIEAVPGMRPVKWVRSDSQLHLTQRAVAAICEPPLQGVLDGFDSHTVQIKLNTFRPNWKELNVLYCV